MATIDFEPEDYLHEVSVEALRRELAARGGATPRGEGDGDYTVRRYVDEAEMAVRGMAACPAAIKDLLWNVHGRAIA